MLTGELRSKVDRLWEAFWSGGVANPLTVIEQITYLLFIKRLDELHTQKENKANITGKPIEDPIFTPEQYLLRWSRFKNLDAEEMYRLMIQDKGVLNFMKELAAHENSTYARYMKGATFMIPTPNLLERVEYDFGYSYGRPRYQRRFVRIPAF